MEQREVLGIKGKNLILIPLPEFSPLKPSSFFAVNRAKRSIDVVPFVLSSWPCGILDNLLLKEAIERAESRGKGIPTRIFPFMLRGTLCSVAFPFLSYPLG